MSSLQIRHACETELPTIVQLMITAFRGRAMNDTFFPDHLRSSNGYSEELKFRTRNISRNFDNKHRHRIVVVDDRDLVLGYAEWTNGGDPVVGITSEERDKKKSEGIKRLPEGFDLQAAEKAMREIEMLSDMLKEALGREGYENSWSELCLSTCNNAVLKRDNVC